LFDRPSLNMLWGKASILFCRTDQRSKWNLA
jgi:hypothetical protein